MAKKIINGKMYNTETAEQIWQYVCDGRISEKLYLKRTGEFFLYGEGGEWSVYCEEYNMYRVGRGLIIPLPLEAAKEWAMVNMDADSYIETFGEVEE